MQTFDQGGDLFVDPPAFEALAAQQGQRTVIGQLHAPLVVKHQNASTHALQDQGIEGFQADDFAGFLFCQGFADFQSSDQALHQQ
ncbi:hypothetical protein D3C72_2381950 [compost metagenome]